MLYMFAALAGPASGGGSGMAGMTAGSSGGMQTLHAPTLALVFVLLLIAYTVRDLDRKACADGYFHVVGLAFHARRARTGHRGRGRDGPRCSAVPARAATAPSRPWRQPQAAHGGGAAGRPGDRPGHGQPGASGCCSLPPW